MAIMQPGVFGARAKCHPVEASLLRWIELSGALGGVVHDGIGCPPKLIADVSVTGLQFLCDLFSDVGILDGELVDLELLVIEVTMQASLR